jgi:hypothetical protein
MIPWIVQAASGELKLEGLKEIALATSVDVTKEGVGGAKNFFEAHAKKASRCSTPPTLPPRIRSPSYPYDAAALPLGIQKAYYLCNIPCRSGSAFEEEIKAEQEERKKEAAAAAERKAEFKKKMSSFH